MGFWIANHNLMPEELRQLLWRIADTLRGKMDADDFHDSWAFRLCGLQRRGNVWKEDPAVSSYFRNTQLIISLYFIWDVGEQILERVVVKLVIETFEVKKGEGYGGRV